MSEWATVTLADLLEPVGARRRDQPISMVLSVTEKRGIVPQDEVFKKRIATEDTSKYKVVQPLDIAYNPYLLWTGAIGQWNGSAAGVTSPVYEVFRTRSGHDPRFVGLVLTGGSLTPYFDATAIGSIQRRRRTPVSVFLAAETAAPPLPEQRRIVAVVSALDAQIAALDAEMAAARRVLRRFLTSEMEKLSGIEVPIVDTCTKVIGGIWGSPAGESEVDVLALGPRVYGFGTSNLQTKGSPVRSLSRKQVEDRLVLDGDIILERSGGSPEQPVGRVVIAGPNVEPCVPTDFQRLLRPDPQQVAPRFLYWTLQSSWNEGVSLNYSRKTTGITNLSVKDYIARPTMIPPKQQQDRFVSGADALEAVVQSLSGEVNALRVVRADLLTALLSREITVDAAVDKFVKAA